MPRPDDRPPPPIEHEWPFVGRAAERRIGERAFMGTAAGVVIVGPPGCGKSALAERLLAAHPERSLVCTVQAELELGDESFGALIPVVLDHLENGSGTDLSSATVLRALRARIGVPAAGSQPPVLRVEDANLLDLDSAAVLAQLATAGLATLLVTSRMPQHVAPALARLWRDGTVTRIDLAPLTGEELDDAAAGFLGGPLTFAASDALHRATLGNPRFLRELVTHAHRSGTLERRDAAWTWTGDLDPGGRLTELIASALHFRSDAARQVLALVALTEPIPVSVLAEVTDPTAIDDLEAEGIIVASDDPVPLMSLANPLHRDVVRELIPRARRVELHRTLIEPLDTHTQAMIHSTVRATLWALGCGVRFDARHLFELARRANLHHDYSAAERLASATLGRDPNGAAHVELAYALRFLGRSDEAETVLKALPDEISDPQVRIAATQLHMGIAQFVRDDLDTALRICDAASTTARDPAERAALQMTRHVSLGFSDHFAEVIDDLATIAADPALPTAVAASAVAPLATGLSLRGEYASAGRFLDLIRKRTNANEDGNRWIIEEETSTRVFVCIQRGDLASAQSGMQSMFAVADPSVHFDRGLHQIGQARVALLQGRAVTALSEIRGAIAALEVSDPSGFMAWALGVAVEVAALCDEPGLSAAFAERARTTPLRLSHLLHTDLRRSLLWAVAMTAGPIQAAREGRDLAAEMHGRGLLGMELQVLHDVYRFGGHDVAERSLALASSLEGPRAEALTQLMGAEVDGDAHAFVAASEAFEDFGAWLYAAEAASIGARRFTEAGRTTSARDATKRVTRLRRLTGPVTSPLLTDSGRVELTAREREVAWLAARGLTNPQIAAQINVAPRTVEGHLHRLYAKLGVSDRSELKDLLEA